MNLARRKQSKFNVASPNTIPIHNRLLVCHLPRLHIPPTALPLALMKVDFVRVLDDADARTAVVIAALLQIVLLLDRIALVVAHTPAEAEADEPELHALWRC